MEGLRSLVALPSEVTNTDLREEVNTNGMSCKKGERFVPFGFPGLLSYHVIVLLVSACDGTCVSPCDRTFCLTMTRCSLALSLSARKPSPGINQWRPLNLGISGSRSMS